MLNFHDIKHIAWLAKNGLKHALKGEVDGVKESYYLIRIHLAYDSKRK